MKLQLADGTVYNHDGHVATVSGVIDPTTGTVSMRADFPNPEHLLKSGASGSIVVPHVSSSAIIIPQDAVSQVQDKFFVYVVGEGADLKVGAPYVEGATVAGTAEKTGKQKKIIVYKMKPKKGYRRKQGHRQPYTKVRIDAIKA